MRTTCKARSFLVLAMAGGAACGSGSPLDGEWNAAAVHTLVFSGDRYESGDPDAVGTCREQGDFRIEGDQVTLSVTTKGCPVAPKTLSWDGMTLTKEDGLVYIRGHVTLTPITPP